MAHVIRTDKGLFVETITQYSIVPGYSKLALIGKSLSVEENCSNRVSMQKFDFSELMNPSRFVVFYFDVEWSHPEQPLKEGRSQNLSVLLLKTSTKALTHADVVTEIACASELISPVKNKRQENFIVFVVCKININ